MVIASPKSALNVVMGTMLFGEPGTTGAQVQDIKVVEAILDTFKSHGHTEIDTARTYGGGTTEEYLGRLNLPNQGLKLETKLFPTISFPLPGTETMSHTPEDLRTYLLKSLGALNVKSVEMWYLHGPDRTTPFEVTLKCVNELYQEGYFKRFGLSNYSPQEVAEVVQICRANGYVQPTVYQGRYSVVHRGSETELFPCLRKYNISFYAYSPLGGGLLTGKYTSMDSAPAGSRYDSEQSFSQIIRMGNWEEPIFNAIDSIRTVAEKHGLTMAEVALRWMSHHSSMKREYEDAVVIGASSTKHIEQNLIDLEKGPLPEEVVQVLEAAWVKVEASATK